MKNASFRRAARVGVFTIVAAPLALGLVLIWGVELVLFAPALLAAVFARRSPAEVPSVVATAHRPRGGRFNRVSDVSKLHGCRTRNISYRWGVFVDAIAALKARLPAGYVPRAFDFGAGSLRETYELARLGFHVVANDLDHEAINDCAKYYDWASVPLEPTLQSTLVTKGALAGQQFDVITAFDVIEHLHQPDQVLAELRSSLSDDGIMLVTVPNRRSLWEQVYRWQNQRRLQAGQQDYSGVPHVQFRDPAEWEQFFRGEGFAVAAHEMGIGVFVNDAWAALYGIPLRMIVEPVVASASRALGWNYVPLSLEKLFYPRWLMVHVDVLDRWTRHWLSPYWGWNLFVLKKTGAGR